MSGNGGSGTSAGSASHADKRPNELLTSWFARSGWSKGELARQVNRRARQLGANHISTDTSRVRRWLDGENPREPIPRILSELFSERFGVVVSVEDLLESTAVMFRRWDAQCGGGLRRKAVVGQLHEVTDLLQEPQTETTRAKLFKVAAELAELAGWMSYDVGLQPTAQKYFVLALHAAKEAGDRPLGSYILSSMSRQMIHLGRPDDALELIHLAQYGSRDCASPRTQSMLYAMEARAYANMGQPGRTKRAVRMAEDIFAEADEWDEPDPDWIRFFSEAELYGENSHSFRDLAYVAGRSPAYASLADPLMRRAVELFAKDEEHQRSYALNLIGMATVHLLRREPEESTVLAMEAMGIAKKVRSERVNTRIRKTVDTAVRDFGDLGEVVDLTERLAVELPETAEAV